ncbi:hypothetical protein BG000_008466 [Podila horticola]|nr:hypothetical protein BG000_008466 [Podila horticola]
MSDRGSKRSSRRNSDADTETESESGEPHRDQDHRGGGGSHNTGSSREHSRNASVDSTRKIARDPSTPTSSSSTSKRPKRNPSVKCPICRENVAPGQYQQHYRMELAQLEAGASTDLTRGKRGAAIAATKQFNKGKSRGSANDEEKRVTIRDIQKRRTARQNNKDSGSGSGGRPSDLDLGLVRGLGSGEDSPATCFICNERLFGSLEDINNHIDACLTNPQPAHSHHHSGYGSSGPNTPSGSMSSTTPNNSHNNNRVDSFEEYTWAGQTRVRATALFEGGMGALGSGSGSGPGSRSAQTDIDDDLNVEDDEEEEYGGAQFTERDIVMDDDGDPDADELREIVMASSSAVKRAVSPPRRVEEGKLVKKGMKAKKRIRPDRDVDIMDEGDDPGDVDDEEVDEDAEIDLEGDGQEDEEEEEEDEDEEDNVDAQLGAAFASGDTRLVIDALRAKIKHLESANRNVPSCLICLDPYTVPLTSIVCWHVHCEACWMKTLGSKKLCPQCQKITLPKDLRRIYL